MAVIYKILIKAISYIKLLQIIAKFLQTYIRLKMLLTFVYSFLILYITFYIKRIKMIRLFLSKKRLETLTFQASYINIFPVASTKNNYLLHQSSNAGSIYLLISSILSFGSGIKNEAIAITIFFFVLTYITLPPSPMAAKLSLSIIHQR